MKTTTNVNELTKPSTDKCAILGNTLIRRADGWHWSDGSPEPRVTDLTLGQCYNFACQQDKLLEVPVFLAEAQPDLAWVKDGNYRKAELKDPQYVQEFLSRFPERRLERVQTYLVPRADWDGRASEIVAACYDPADLPRLRKKAISLGCSWPADSKAATQSNQRTEDTKPFELNELKLIADAVNGINLILIMHPDSWNAYGMGRQLYAEVRDAMYLKRLDLAFEVDGNRLLQKLDLLRGPGLRALVLGLAEFWNCRNENSGDEFFQQLGDQIFNHPWKD